MDDYRIRPASDILSKVLGPSSAARVEQWAGVFSGWSRVAGDQLAAHSKPVDIKNGIVIVEADHPGWIQHLQFRQERMLRELVKTYPELDLKGLAFRLASRDSAYPIRDIARNDQETGGSADVNEEPEDDTTVDNQASDELASRDPEFAALLKSVSASLKRKKPRAS
ncbi:MAG: DUF721 domain-containing protein [Spirochaetales bacterium]|nr:DUF721 domain-containing protein [Spirochaetales bacterium]